MSTFRRDDGRVLSAREGSAMERLLARDPAWTELAAGAPPSLAAAPGPPPKAGAGSGRDAWAAHARALGIEVTAGMDRAAIIAAVEGGR